MKLYYDSEEEFMQDYNEKDFDIPVYSESEQKKRHKAIINGAMRAKWGDNMLRTCPIASVKDVYGTSTVPIWICFGCKYVKRMQYCGAIGCDYKE